MAFGCNGSPTSIQVGWASKTQHNYETLSRFNKKITSEILSTLPKRCFPCAMSFWLVTCDYHTRRHVNIRSKKHWILLGDDRTLLKEQENRLTWMILTLDKTDKKKKWKLCRCLKIRFSLKFYLSPRVFSPATTNTCISAKKLIQLKLSRNDCKKYWWGRRRAEMKDREGEGGSNKGTPAEGGSLTTTWKRTKRV